MPFIYSNFACLRPSERWWKLSLLAAIHCEYERASTQVSAMVQARRYKQRCNCELLLVRFQRWNMYRLFIHLSHLPSYRVIYHDRKSLISSLLAVTSFRRKMQKRTGKFEISLWTTSCIEFPLNFRHVSMTCFHSMYGTVSFAANSLFSQNNNFFLKSRRTKVQLILSVREFCPVFARRTNVIDGPLSNAIFTGSIFIIRLFLSAGNTTRGVISRFNSTRWRTDSTVWRTIEIEKHKEKAFLIFIVAAASRGSESALSSRSHSVQSTSRLCSARFHFSSSTSMQ